MSSISRRKLNAVIDGAAEVAALPAGEIKDAMAERKTVLVGDYYDPKAGDACPSAALVLARNPEADLETVVNEANGTFAAHFDTMLGYEPPHAFVLEIR
jgi:hypothetical protein